MKEKVFKREKESVKTELTTGEAKTETKTETEEIVKQETICQNINNLTTSLNSLNDVDGNLFIGEKFDETKTNILNAIYVLSTHLITEEQV